MRKYLTLLTAIGAAIALLSLSLPLESTAGLGPGCSFYGAAKAGRTVTACKLPNHSPCYQTTADVDNEYCFSENIPHGFYWLSDGCQSYQAAYFGCPVRVDFCIPDPPLHNCNCY
jgi:hypothetical protein